VVAIFQSQVHGRRAVHVILRPNCNNGQSVRVQNIPGKVGQQSESRRIGESGIPYRDFPRYLCYAGIVGAILGKYVEQLES